MPNRIVLALSLMSVMEVAALAQEPAEAVRGQNRDPHMPAPNRTVPEKRGEGPVTVTNDRSQTLSKNPGSSKDRKK